MNKLIVLVVCSSIAYYAPNCCLADTPPPIVPYSTNAATDSSTTCYNSSTNQYSINQNGGSGVNCSLSIKFD